MNEYLNSNITISHNSRCDISYQYFDGSSHCIVFEIVAAQLPNYDHQL